VVAVGAAELTESIGPQAIDDIPVGHYVPLLEFNHFTAGSSEVDIEALAARYQNEDFWRRSMSEAEDESPSV